MIAKNIAYEKEKKLKVCDKRIKYSFLCIKVCIARVCCVATRTAKRYESQLATHEDKKACANV